LAEVPSDTDTSCTRGSWARAATSARWSMFTFAASSSAIVAGSRSTNGGSPGVTRNATGAPVAAGEDRRETAAATRAASRSASGAKPSA
jgi:hypothetical protein